MHAWKEHTLQVNGHEMAWFEVGYRTDLSLSSW